MKLFLSAVSLTIIGTMIIVLTTAFTSPERAKDYITIESNNEGVVAQVYKDRGWYLVACDQAVLAESSIEVYLDDTRVMITNIWKLPEGHCLIPEKGAAIYANLVVTSNGTAKGQAIVRPEDL